VAEKSRCRNLHPPPSVRSGRDDRVISAHGREARFPFLDERLIDYIARLPLNVVTDMGEGGGDKAVLRDAARLLGLRGAADEAKRAIQFGTRWGARRHR
jgi:asparagine synthetase B (glutamine-hydrolysing)